MFYINPDACMGYRIFVEVKAQEEALFKFFDFENTSRLKYIDSNVSWKMFHAIQMLESLG